MFEKKWKLTDPDAGKIIDQNIRNIEQIFEGLWKKCGNPYCKYPISSIATKTYGCPEYGDICVTCHDLYAAITMMNPQLTNPSYFRNHHEKWKKDGDDKGRRDRLGL